MNWIEIFLLAFALSIDALVVSFSYGILQKNNWVKNALLLALFTGVFQGLMPLISGLCTDCVQSYIAPFSKWIVFIIFLYLGINFIKQAFNEKKPVNDLNLGILFMLAIATSIDAFSIGIPLSLKLDNIILPVCIISIVTFTNSILGFICGRFFAQVETKYLEIFGGIILIALALRVVL